MQRHSLIRVRLAAVFLSILALLSIAAASRSTLNSYSTALRRYPYLTDVVGPYATINWATDRSDTAGLVRYGKAGAEECTAHAAIPTKTAISVNGVPQYQWKAQLSLEPGTQYCYRVYLGTSPLSQVDLLGSDPSPAFWTQVPAGADEPFSFAVFGDWGYVGASGTNPYQAALMQLIAESGARFALTTGDNGYPDGNQKNLGDLVQSGQNISTIFGPVYWRVPGASLPIFPALGNHDHTSPDLNHPFLLTWPQDRAVSTSGGRYTKETYCCLNGSASGQYPSAWYAFDAGPARFYVLQAAWDEVNIGSASEYEMDYDYRWAPGTPQLEWLKADLAAHPSVLKFAFLHYPIYSDNPIESSDTFLQGSDGLEGVLRQHGVDLAFTGHAHIYERNLPGPTGIHNYITGGGGAPLGTLGTCTALDAYAIKFTTSGGACGSAPVPTSPAQVYHFLKVSVNGTQVTVTPINSLGESFDVISHSFTAGAETTPPSQPGGLSASAVSGTQVDLSWPASSDNSGVRGYGVYRDGMLIATVGKDTLSYSDTGLEPETAYTYRVDAFDGSGNHSTPSTARSAITHSTAAYLFETAADVYVSGDFPSTNYGTAAFLKADASPSMHSYLRFYVEDLAGTVTRATLRLYTTSSSAVGYQVRRVNSPGWEEGKVTFAGGPGAGAAVGASGNFAAGSWTSVDVTPLISGRGVYDLALTTTSAATLNFHSREAGSNRPQLIVETSAGSGTLFADVPAGHWAQDFIERLYRSGITGGCSTAPLMYCPAAPVTRAQMAVFLLRGMHGSDYQPPAASGNVFADVPKSHWAAAWIEQLSAEGITSGCGGNSYCPEAAVTRDQMAVFLLRAEHGSDYIPPAASGNAFGDVPAGHWAAAWIEQLVRESITAGCGGGNYCPARPVSRDQMAVFLVRTFSLP